ncbi:phage portal protein [Paraburkholderia phymatum]|uniref:Phage portal protein, HK97 family n=1 Tax=Paraburkholderia phymatum (strain DSM 17167 / CIP 108236 / LMG 21445 / STM815) TaxID=391038 RepID=B2JU90_PARP8|nr:phage portal protein [Paraburkholderia phymatum]ACC76143.1 phage portal protein, HK97 family [Paraburkholderia phymatum STM815]
MFLKFRADADDGDRSPWGSFWFSPVPFKGQPHNVTGDAAMRLTAVYACVRVLAEAVSMLPFVLYREGADGSKKPEKAHWLYRLLAVRPNEFQNPMEFREMMMMHLALRGNAFAEIISNTAGIVTDLVPIHPDTITIEMLSKTNWRYIEHLSDGTERIIVRGSMWHIKVMSPDGIVGMNPIQASRESIASGLSAQEYGLRYFENDATPGGWIEYPGEFKDDQQKRNFRESWQTQQSGRNRRKTAVLERGMKYHPIEVKNSDAQYLETRKFSVSEIARLFRIPPHMIGDLEKATFSNIEQQSLEFVIHTLTPWLVRWEEAIRASFIEVGEGLNCEFPTTTLLRGDAQARSMYYHNGILDGWMTRNEARLMENMNPLDGLDEPMRPLNMVEEDEAETQQNAPQIAPKPGKPANPQPEQENDDGPTQARMYALAAAAADRVARKEWEALHAAVMRKESISEFYDKHARFVSAVLGVSDDAARDYCRAQLEYVIENRDDITDKQFADIAGMRLQRLALRGHHEPLTAHI